MENTPRDLEIEPEDFDSIFLWKVFWKLLRQEKPVCFFLKVLLLSVLFVAFVFFLVLVGDIVAGA
jgi:hypothetical protein